MSTIMSISTQNGIETSLATQLATLLSQLQIHEIAGLKTDRFSSSSTHFVIGTASTVPSTHPNTFFTAFAQ